MQVEINQDDRKEFLNWRIEGIGASDIAQIMNCSPYGDYQKLLDEKITGKSVSINKFVAMRGQQVEILGRAYAELQHNLTFQPACFQRDGHEWKKASLDGWNPEQRIILEVKYVGAEIFKKTRGVESVKANMKHYYLQIQWQLHVVPEARFALLCLIDSKNNKHIIKIDRDGNVLDFSVIDKFWDEVVKNRNGEKPLVDVATIVEQNSASKKLRIIEDENLESLLSNRKILVDLISKKQEELKMLEANIKALPVFKIKTSFSCGDFGVLAIEKKGNVDYKKIPQLEGVNVEKFRKPSTQYWKFK